MGVLGVMILMGRVQLMTRWQQLTRNTHFGLVRNMHSVVAAPSLVVAAVPLAAPLAVAAKLVARHPAAPTPSAKARCVVKLCKGRGAWSRAQASRIVYTAERTKSRSPLESSNPAGSFGLA